MQLQNQESLSTLDLLQTTILKFVKEGVLVISNQLSLLYMNAKAQKICHKILLNSDSINLPPVILEITNHFAQQPLLEGKTIIQDFCLPDDYVLRIKVINISTDRNPSSSSVEQPWLLFLIEDKNDNLQEEIEIARGKYGLTDREAEVYGLLSQSKTYQDIAQTLYISLNTVRSHVKKINEKRRNYYPFGSNIISLCDVNAVNKSIKYEWEKLKTSIPIHQ